MVRLIYLVLLLVNFSALAKPVVLTAEFGKLLQYHVSQIPELRRMWNQMAVDNVPDKIHLSGGILRGLIHYLQLEVNRRGLVDSYRVETPSIEHLLLQEWSDRDLVMPEVFVRWAKELVPGKWDMLTQDFMKDSIRSGGAEIEKVAVSPRSISDPYDALDKYLHGKLEFVVTAHELNAGQLYGNTRLAQALRFLRIAANLPEAKITPKSWDHLRQIADSSEWNSIRRGEASDYWVLKSLKKLYHAAGKRPFEFLITLHDANLLPILARHHFSLPIDERIDWDRFDFDYFLRTRGHDWSTAERIDAAEVLGTNKSDKLYMLDLLAQHARTGEVRAAIEQRRSLIAEKFGENDLTGGRNANGQQCLQGVVKIAIGQPQIVPNRR